MAKPRAVVYLRDSSEAQRLQGTSIPAQRKACAEYAKRSAYRMVGEYVDDGYSGRSLKRDRFRALLRDARERLFDVIVLYDTDRFDRSRDAAVELDKLREIGVRVEYVVFPVQYDRLGRLTPESALTEDQKKAFDRYFSLKLGRDVLRGNKEVVGRGFRAGGSAPYGYRIKRVADGQAERCTIEPDPLTAPVVRQIFDLKAQGLGDRKVRDWLNERRVAAPRRAAWHERTIAALIANRAYLGELTYNRQTWVRDFGSQSRRPVANPRNEWLVVPGAHAPLIDQGLFDAAQAFRTRKRPHARASSDWHVYLLSGLIRCAKCSSRLWSQKQINGERRAYYRYRCPKGCGPAVPSDAVERAVLATLGDLASDREQMDRAWRSLKNPGESPDMAALEREIAEADRRAANVLKAVENGNVRLGSRYTELCLHADAARRRLGTLRAAAQAFPATRTAFVHALRSLSKAVSKAADADRALLKKALRAFVHEVSVEPDGTLATIKYTLPAVPPSARTVHCGGLICAVRAPIGTRQANARSIVWGPGMGPSRGSAQSGRV